MYVDTNELFLYRKFEQQTLFDNITGIINNYENINYEEIKKIIYPCANELIEFGMCCGFEGNLWHCFLTYLLVNNENSYSRSLEIGGSATGTITRLALNDFRIFKQLFDFDLTLIDKVLGLDCLCFVSDFSNPDSSKALMDADIIQAFRELTDNLRHSGDPQVFCRHTSDFYRQHGVGKFAMYKAFKVCLCGQSADIVPIANTGNIYLDDLVGYELQKKELIKNTEDFINGYKANNVLLYGDSGTGKSSSIKAILNEYSSRGLRMIEVYKHQFGYLQEIIQQVRNRNYKFIIYMDDLSFEDYETEYKYLKAIIEGGLEMHPGNVLLYATSNRRHLIREKWSDKDDRDDDLHTNDTVQEKLSLAARFGLSILYISPNKKEFNNIVRVLARKNNIALPEEELFLEANKWEMRHGGLSGRTAQHFITYLKTKL
jgi:predicted AAA+ superfamily ATPase